MLAGVVGARGLAVHAMPHEVLAHGGPCHWGQEQHRCGLGGRGADDDGVLHGIVLFQRLHHLHHGGALLANGDVDADNAVTLLVDDLKHLFSISGPGRFQNALQF